MTSFESINAHTRCGDLLLAARRGAITRHQVLLAS
jgi:hypothetical protein